MCYKLSKIAREYYKCNTFNELIIILHSMSLNASKYRCSESFINIKKFDNLHEKIRLYINSGY